MKTNIHIASCILACCAAMRRRQRDLHAGCHIAAAVAALAAPLLFAACSADDPDTSSSVIVVDKVDFTEFDYWLQRNYVAPYNIEFKYRFEDKESDMNYYTVPARYELAVKMAHIVKYLCLETYDEVAGMDFTRAYFPKMVFCIGEWEYRNNGTYVLGTAEGGRKILLSGVNYLDEYVKNADDLNEYYLKTIHHEFTHILNQTRDYSADFKLITGSGYVADSWSDAPYDTEYLQRGFITAYAQHSDVEDFAEMLSVYIINSETTWNRWMQQAGTEGARLIAAKLDIVKDYMLSSFGTDIDILRACIQRRQKDVHRGYVDLTDISLK